MSFDRNNFKDIWGELSHLEEHFDCSEMDEIVVFENEGNIPHFHVYDKQTKRLICFKIEKAEYFKHGKYQNELMRDERKDLQKWLSLPNEDIWRDKKEISSNYREICIEWNRNNRGNLVDINRKIPDYEHVR